MVRIAVATALEVGGQRVVAVGVAVSRQVLQVMAAVDAGQPARKWSNERFSIIRITTCSMPFEPSGDLAGAARAARWASSSAPVAAIPDAPMS
jgi:hypothetical protein